MNETTILQHLEEIAEKVRLKVNYENLRKMHIFSKGGFYRLQEEHIVLIENTLNLSEKIEIIEAFVSVDIYVHSYSLNKFERKVNRY